MRPHKLGTLIFLCHLPIALILNFPYSKCMEIILIITQLILIFYVLRLNASLKRNNNDIETESRAMNILGRAYQKAQKILGRAELEEVKLVAHAKYQNDVHRDKLDKAFLAEADQAYDKFADYLQRLTDHTEKLEKSWSTAAAGSITKFQKDAQAQIQAELEAYKQSQMASIDANIIKIVTKTITDVLPKTVKPEIQKELVMEALEQAKSDKLI